MIKKTKKAEIQKRNKRLMEIMKTAISEGHSVGRAIDIVSDKLGMDFNNVRTIYYKNYKKKGK